MEVRQLKKDHNPHGESTDASGTEGLAETLALIPDRKEGAHRVNIYGQIFQGVCFPELSAQLTVAHVEIQWI